jgi:hypothetical protein
VSSAPTEQIITPATNASEPVPAHISAAKAQLQQQQIMAFKMITARANASGNPLSQEAMNQLVSAMRSGNLDINAPGMQQIKTLLSLQQQQKQGQASMNPGAAAVAAAQSQASGQNQNPSNDQILMAAMRQQMGQQNQGVAQPQQSTQPQAVQSQPNQQRPQPAPQAQNQRSQQAPVWSGELVWSPSSGTRCKSIQAIELMSSRPISQCQCGRRWSSGRLPSRSLVQGINHQYRHWPFRSSPSSIFKSRWGTFRPVYTPRNPEWRSKQFA